MATESNGGHDSLVCLEMLRDSGTPEMDRVDVFTRMLQLDRGWWGHGTLMKFCAGVALGFARRKLQPFGVSPDRLDWEAIADEALLVLFRDAHQIQDSPRSWLIGTIKTLIQKEIRRSWAELTTTTEIPEIFETQQQEAISDREARSLRLDDAIVDAIRELSPALRVIAELHFVHQVPRDEVASYLGISEATFRKRLQRAKAVLLSKLQKTAGVSQELSNSDRHDVRTFRTLHRAFGTKKGA